MRLKSNPDLECLLLQRQPPAGRPAQRRRDRRVPLPPVEIRPLWATVHDVSLGGVGLDVAAPVTPGDRYRLMLTDQLYQRVLLLTAEVVWCSDGRAGFHWVDLAPDLQQQLSDCLRDWDAYHVESGFRSAPASGDGPEAAPEEGPDRRA